MLSPETWNFPPPACSFLFKKGELKEDSGQCTNIINKHYFNFLVSLILPDTAYIPETLQEELTGDCDYYRVENVQCNELISYDFINAFVKQGCLTILSDGTRIDTDDCVAVTPSGHLVLSLNRKTYQLLGIEGKPSSFSQKTPNRYVVHLDLKQEFFKPGKKNYERIRRCLAQSFNTKHNLLVAWDPPEEKMCPSSVAAYFVKKGYEVHLCHPHFKRQHSYNVQVPLLSPEDDFVEIMEWLGMFSIGAELDSTAPDNFLSTYQCPQNCQEFGNVALLQGKGYYTSKQILQLFDGLRQYVRERKSIPWASLYVQGFADSPLSWGLKENQFYVNGDNNYVIFLRPNDTYVACSYLSSSQRPKSQKSLGKK